MLESRLLILIVIGFAFGIAFGSFMTLVSCRVPAGEDIVFEPSRCPVCRNRLRARDLVPLLSWLFSRGRCRHCGLKISARYPLIELGAGAAGAFLAVYQPAWTGEFFFRACGLVVFGCWWIMRMEGRTVPPLYFVTFPALASWALYLHESPLVACVPTALALPYAAVLWSLRRREPFGKTRYYAEQYTGAVSGAVALFCVALPWGVWPGVLCSVPFLLFSIGSLRRLRAADICTGALLALICSGVPEAALPVLRSIPPLPLSHEAPQTP